MGIAKVKRWQWVVLSLVLGFVVVQVHRALPQPMNAYGAHMTDHKTFEDALVRDVNGERMFRNLVVYPVEVDDGGGKALKHFVAGEYFNGRPLKVAGRWESKWEPYCFVAGVPFVPQTDGEALDPAQRMNLAVARAAAKQGQQTPDRKPDADAGAAGASSAAPSSAAARQTVLDYLDRMGREKGVKYRYAWWLHPRWKMATWVGGSFVLIGLVWPTFVNLMAFGTLRRPAEEGAGLWEMLRGIGARKRAAAPAPAAGPADLSDVEAYDVEVAGRLAATAGPADAIAKIGAHVPKPALSPAAADELLVGAGPHAEHHYEAKRDDFYPTEKKRADDERHGHAGS